MTATVGNTALMFLYTADAIVSCVVHRNQISHRVIRSLADSVFFLYKVHDRTTSILLFTQVKLHVCCATVT